MITDIDDFGDIKNTNNLTIADIAQRAANNGYTVTAFSQSQLSQRDAAIAAANASKPDYELGYGVPWGNSAYRRVARKNRIATRASRKK